MKPLTNKEKLKADLKAYQTDLKAWEASKPKDPTDKEADFAWWMARPNKPGYYRANND